MIIDKKSPWLNKNYNNIFLDEISFVEDPVSNPYYKPMEIFKWICKHKAKKLLFNALALFAPLFPVVSYKGQISSWQSPPPSGLGNVIFIIIGKDDFGKLRCVGGNTFTNHVHSSSHINDFWKSFDECKDDFSKIDLMSDMLGYYKKNCPIEDIRETERIADFSCTMPIYLLVLDKNNNYIATTPAFVKGKNPSDFKYEKIGEVIL